jgi:undecaprenyl-diphosphatase
VVDHRVGALDPIFVAATVVGYAGLVWVALAPVLAAWARRPVLKTTLVTAATVWSADLIATLLKIAFDRPRPFEAVEVDVLVGGTVGGAMPSGHAATAFAGATVLSLLLGRFAPALFGLALVILVSRVYVGVHYPLDVVAGAGLGLAVGLAAAVLVRAPRMPSRGRLRSGGSPRAG